MPVSAERIRALNAEPSRPGGDYVLYRVQVNRRGTENHALAHAVEIANANGLPLLAYEDAGCDSRAASDRFHTFILEGVPDTAAELRRIGAGYFFCPRDESGVLARVVKRAHTVVTDDYPLLAAPALAGIACVAVDSSCIVPMSLHQKRNYGAYTIRPRIQCELPKWLRPVEMAALKRKWRGNLLPSGLDAARAAGCEIDRSVRPSVEYRGGSRAAGLRLELFLEDRLRRYARDSGQPSKHATSNLSPYLHFGQISALEVALAVRAHAEEHKLMPDEFLEQLIVRRELAFNFARFAGRDIESLDVLPDWCKRTMAKHAADPRPFLYTAEQFENAATHDELWNATQRELLLRGTIHGYYRMYWGKKIIEWSPTYEAAFRTMIRLHDVYALDGRDPNTYTNILWCFGLHDRPWGERPVFGQLRYMSLEGMKRKTDVAAYVAEIGSLASNPAFPA